jgi:hypothetical protein
MAYRLLLTYHMVCRRQNPVFLIDRLLRREDVRGSEQ